MARCRAWAVLAACGLVLAACSRGSGPATTASSFPAITFILTVEDTGNVLQVRPGDRVVPRLPLTGYEDAGWLLVEAPNPAVLGGGADEFHFPEDMDQGGAAYQEFAFVAAGPGRTSFSLTHGYQRFTLTVQVAGGG